jgi:hypothetical protein
LRRKPSLSHENLQPQYRQPTDANGSLLPCSKLEI